MEPVDRLPSSHADDFLHDLEYAIQEYRKSRPPDSPVNWDKKRLDTYWSGKLKRVQEIVRAAQALQWAAVRLDMPLDYWAADMPVPLPKDLLSAGARGPARTGSFRPADWRRRQYIAAAIVDVLRKDVDVVWERAKAMDTGSQGRPSWARTIVRLGSPPYRNVPIHLPQETPEVNEGYEVGSTLPGAAWSVVKDASDSPHYQSLLRDLLLMKPPMTWGDLLYYALEVEMANNDAGSRPLRREAADSQRGRTEAVCLLCGEPFQTDKHNPGRVVCPRCNRRAREQRYEEGHRRRHGKDST